MSLPLGLPETKYSDASFEVKELIPVAGSTLTNSGESLCKIELPQSGVWYGKDAVLSFDLGLTISSNEAQLVRGNAGCVWDKMRVLVGGLVVHDYGRMGFQNVQRMKWTRPTDWITNLGPSIGYYASATDVAAATVRYFIPMPDKCLLTKNLPLFKMPKIEVELILDQTTNNYTSTNTGSNARSVTVSNISLIAPIYKATPAVKSLFAKDVVGTVDTFTNHYDSIANGATTQTFKIPVSGSSIAGFETYFLHASDVTSHTLNDKYWDTQFLSTSKVEVYVDGETLIPRGISGDEGVQFLYHAMRYFDYDINSRDYQFMVPINNFDTTDGDFVVAVKLSAFNNVVSGISKQSTLEIKWQGSAGEAALAYTYVKYNRLFKIPAAGGFEIAQ